MPPEKVSLASATTAVKAPWTPAPLAALNGQLVKLVRTEGPFVWHAHADEDELFLVVEGALDLHFEDGTVHLGPSELCVVPRGVRHKPEGDAVVLLFEPAETVRTGDAAAGEAPGAG
jgi:mannose-6-phosphate isomerase-like protein (cupin superfamily)